jgi:ABC-type dipeptide/oligopeptide/nickel transport system ATPase component
MAAKKVEPGPERVILLIAGESGSGKSFWVANLKNALIFDTDIGGGLSYADARIRRNGSERIEVGSYLDVIKELTDRRKSRALDNITTLAIDHLSTLQQEAVLRHNPTFEENTFGKEHDRANKEWRKIRDLVRFGDFNLVCTAHMKAKYENKKQVGMITDASKNVEGDFHIVLQTLKGSSAPTTENPPKARVLKWRRDPDDERGLVPPEFVFTMAEFLRLHGVSMEGRRMEIATATEEQVAELNRLLEVVKLPEGTKESWLRKAKAESFDDFSEDVIVKCLEHVRNLVASPAA